MSAKSSATSWAMGVGCLVFASIGLFLRAPDTLLNPQFIAEDGGVFFVDQFGHLVPQLFKLHQGYLVALPRLIAWIASTFKAIHAPFVYNVAANLVAAGCIGYFCVRARAIFHPCASFAVILLLPMISGELFGLVTNVQWFAQLAIVAACLLPRPAGSRGPLWSRTAQLVLLAVIALTGPYAILCGFVYFALIACHWLARSLRLAFLADPLGEYLESLDENCVAIVMTAGLVLMIIAATQNAIPAQHQENLFLDFIRGAVGEGVQAHMLGLILWPWPEFVALQGALLAATLLWRAKPNVRIGCLVLLGYGWLCLITGYLKMKALDMAIGDINYIDRYVFACAVFQWLVIWRIGSDEFVGEMPATWLVIAALALIGFHNPLRLCRAPPPDMDWPKYAQRIDAGQAVDVVIAPGWRFHVPPPDTRR
jgi:hypothetical protein